MLNTQRLRTRIFFCFPVSFYVRKDRFFRFSPPCSEWKPEGGLRLDFPRRGAAAAAASVAAAAAAAAAAALLHTTTCMTGGRKEAKEMTRHERSTIFLTTQETYHNNAKICKGKLNMEKQRRE